MLRTPTPNDKSPTQYLLKLAEIRFFKVQGTHMTAFNFIFSQYLESQVDVVTFTQDSHFCRVKGIIAPVIGSCSV